MILSIFLQAESSGFMSMLPFLAMILVLYFFMIRPQMNRQKKEKKFQAEIGKGSKVITTSGIHGKIIEVNESDNTVTVETGAGKIKFERASISLELTKKVSPEAIPAKK
jgi:preprotein translocase subunit YajC